MQYAHMKRTPPPGADNTLFDLAVQSRQYRNIWQALLRMGLKTADYVRAPWLNSVFFNRDAITVLALLRAEPSSAALLLPLMHEYAGRLHDSPVWMHLIGDHPSNTAHAQMALATRAAAWSNEDWNRLITFALPRMTNATVYRSLHEWQVFLDIPCFKAARKARKAERQLKKGRVKGPKGGDPNRRPGPISSAQEPTTPS